VAMERCKKECAAKSSDGKQEFVNLFPQQRKKKKKGIQKKGKKNKKKKKTTGKNMWKRKGEKRSMQQKQEIEKKSL